MMSEQAFSFAHPWVLLGLIAVPLLALLYSARGGAPAVVFSSLDPFRGLGRVRRARTAGWLLGLLLGALALFIVALAGPRWETETSRSEESGIDIMLTLDISPSMNARDFTIGGLPATRLEAVQQVTERFIRGRPHDRIGLTVFSGRPAVISPVTLDHEWLLKNLERLRVGLMVQRTAIGSAIASAANRLKDLKDSKSRVIVLLTDGDNNAGSVAPNDAAEAARLLGIKIYTICAGSRGDVDLQNTDAYGRPTTTRLTVEADESALRKIAEIGGGEFFRATDLSSLDEIFQQIDRLERTQVESMRTKEFEEWFPWFVAAGTALLAASVVLGETAWRKVP